MMQKISLNKTAFNIFTFTLKKNLGFALVASILSFMISPVYLYNTITDYVTSYDKLIYSFDNILLIFASVMAVAIMAFFMVLLYINFSFLYNKSASDYFHALPLKRSELLFSRFFGSYIAALIPLTVGYIGAYGLSFLDYVAANRSDIIEAYLFTVIMMLLLGIFTVLFIITAGGVFDSILSLCAVNIGVPIIVAFISSLCSNHLYGFTYQSDFETGIMSYTTPFGYALIKLILGLSDAEDTLFTTLRVVGSFGVIILFFVLAILLYNRRKTEKLGGSYAFKFIPELIGFIIACIGLFVMGAIFGEAPTEVAYWIAGPIGACLAAVIYSLIINRGFKKVKRALIVGVAASVVLIITNFGIKLDIFGWQYNLPTADEISSVKIQCAYLDIDVKDIDLAVELNNAIVKEHEIYYRKYPTNYFTFTYTLKNGKTVERVYAVESEAARSLKARLISEEYSRQILEDFNEFKGKECEAWELNGYIYSSSGAAGTIETIISEEKAEELVNAYVNDLKLKGDRLIDNLNEYGQDSISIYSRVVITEDVEIFDDGTERIYTDYADFSISVDDYKYYDNFTKVLSTIEYEIKYEEQGKY